MRGAPAVVIGICLVALLIGALLDSYIARGKVADASHELLLAKQARDFQRDCMPAVNQRTTIRWKQDGLFCIKQEWNGKRLIEVEVKRVETMEGFLAYPLGRKE